MNSPNLSPTISYLQKGAETELMQVSTLFQNCKNDRYCITACAVNMVGGVDRRNMLNKFFKELRQSGKELHICTRSLRGTAIVLLRCLGFLQYFEQVAGRVTSAFNSHGGHLVQLIGSTLGHDLDFNFYLRYPEVDARNTNSLYKSQYCRTVIE